jgi:FixJ family two-component response regulator
MPGKNGKELYDLLRRDRPQIKVLFMSGYTGDVIAHHGILEEGVHFLQKPFTGAALSHQVRRTLAS